MASFNDEASVEDKALTDREDEGVRDTLIDLHHSMVHQEERHKPSSQTAARWYQSLPGHRNANDRNANDGRMDGTVLTAAAYDFACSSQEADILALVASEAGPDPDLIDGLKP
jgi:hypothetical protein